MSWKSIDDGWAEFHDPASDWVVRLKPDQPQAGLFIVPPGHPPADPPVVRLLPPWDAPTSGANAPAMSEAGSCGGPRSREGVFPSASETYFRGRDCVATMPETDACHFGIQIRHRVLATSGEYVAVETVVALQTQLLDSHPTVDLVSDHPAERVSAVFPPAGTDDPVLPASMDRRSNAPPHVTRISFPGQVAPAFLLLGPSDAAAAAEMKSNAPMRYRLLAEFLEKGVIRKARFWTCQWIAPTSVEEVRRAYHELIREPLPLTP